MLADRFASLMSRSRSLGLSLAIAVAAGLAVIQVGMLVHVNNREQADLKASAQQRAETALNMLSAVHTNAMRHRRSTKDGDGAIATLNGTMAQFSSSRDQVTLWMVMGPKIIAFQTANKSDEIEGPRDAVDQRAVDSGTAQETFGDDSLRSVRPVLFGQGLATRASCGGCHEALMGIKPGEVMGAYSAKVDLREHSAALAARLRTEAGLTIAAICALVAMVMGMASILILRPIDRMRRAATAFAAADYDVEIGETERRDEIGALARALTFFRDRMIDRQRLENELSQQQSHSDQAQRDSDRVRQLAQSKAAERDAQQHAMLQLSERFEQSVAIIVDAVHTAAVGLAQAADQMVVAAEGASVEADTIAGASGQANDNVGRVARATEELSNSIEMIAEQVLRQSELTGLANQRSEEGAATVQRLSTKAENIRGILSLVQNVAGQTNLLALNASIESARAGVAGRGFAVVANEVKALANQTSASLEDIDAIVQSVRAEVDETVGSITTVARSLGEVRGIAASLAASVSQQKLVASEISEHAATAADGTSLVNRSIVNLAAISRQAGEMARDVKQMSLSLSSQADTLNGAASSFISHLRDDGEQRVAQG